MKGSIYKKFSYPLLVVIFLAGVFLRFYQLGEIPIGLNNDEASIGYNAYSILETGKDEYGVSYPVYFESYSDVKMPFYMYATSLAISYFGVNEFSVRVTSALFGSITILAIYFLTELLLKRKTIALAAAFFIAINPWQFFFSRAGFEVNVATAFLTLGVLFFVIAVSKKRYMYMWGFLSILGFVLAMYTYNATRVLSPVLFLSLFFFYWRDIGKQKIVKVIGYIVVFLLCAIPLLASSTPQGEAENQSTLFIFSGETFGKTLEYRGYLSVLPPFLSKILFNIPVLTGITYIKNIASFFSADFFFVNGANHPINGTTNHGMFYLFELLTIPTGIFIAIKKRITPLYFFIYWIGITVCLVSFTKEVPHPTRMFSVVIPLTILSAYGFVCLLDKMRNIKAYWVKRFAYALVMYIIFFSVIHYLVSYFVYFPVQYAKTWRSEDKDLSLFLLDLEKSYDRIIFDKESGFLYASLLFYGRYDPEIVQSNAVYTQNGLLRTMEKLNTYEFRSVDLEKDKMLPNTVIVSSQNTLPGVQLIRMFYYPTKPVVMYVDGVNHKLDIQDTAYGVYKTN